MKQLKDIDRELANVLLEAVERKEFRVTYKEVAERVSPRLGHTVNPHYELAHPLGMKNWITFGNARSGTN